MTSDYRNIDFKIQIPVLVPFYVTREKLREEYREKKAIVFHAGAGFGKTMAMAQIAHQWEGKCAWYQLEPSDNDPVLFLKILRASLGRALPELRGEPKDDTTVMTVEALAEALWKETVEPVLMVFDDFQEIVNEEIYGFLTTLILRTPDRVTFFFATKGAFPPFLAAFLAREQASLVGQKEMKFTFLEAAEFLEKITGEKFQSEFTERIYAYAEGWPIGLRFAGMALMRSSSGTDLPAMFRDSRIYDYIAYEVFRKLPYELQQFLLDTSVLEAVSPSLCDYVTGKTNSRNNLEYLVRENLFVYRLEGEKVWYRYHSIFKEFLILSLPEERRKEICRKAAAYYTRRREFEQAVHYAIFCRDYDKDRLIPRLGVRCMGDLKVWSEGGKAVAWRTKKTRELFVCLLAEQGREMDKERMIELLWPERDVQKSSALFDTTVSYLKKALSAVDCGHVFVVENKKYRLEMGAIRSDYSRFLEVTSQIANGSFELVLPEGPKALAELYRQGYLAGEDYPWAVTEQERLEQRYLDAMFLLTDHYMEHEDWRLAAQTAALALETDPFFGELVGMYIDSLVRAGDIRGARKQYQRLNDLWQKELGQELDYGGEL